MIDSEKILKNKGLSITKNRKNIIEALDDSHHYHTLNEIKEHIPKFNLKSIYNSLNVMISAGIIFTISINNELKYGLNDQIIKGHDDIHISKGSNIFHIHLNEKIHKEIVNTIKKEGYKIKKLNIIVEVEDS